MSLKSSVPQAANSVSQVLMSDTLGTVTFAADGEITTFDVALDAPEFAEEFLSMRPFRCLAGAKETWCHLPYPYETKKRSAANDLADLEYAVLFLFKPPAGYGIDAWNGLYFKLAMDNDGNLDGTLHEADFNVLAVPPERGNLRPVEHSALTPVTAGAHRFSRLKIR